ncbi:TPA: Dam family site-specific DNA-(adenine-N6)-methyltransferase, partial [Escherichia coli]
WRIVDAQYFGVAQRRRRVFVVASARTDLDPATVLFEFEGVRRNIAPSRGEGKETTRYTSNIAIRTCDDTNIIAMAHGQGGAEIKTDNSAPTLTCNHEAPIVLLGDGRMRRLTPVECERLQGFPDWHTLIPTGKRKKVSSDELAYLRNNYPDLNEEEAAMLAADGPRYKAIGNSMAIPVMRWIGDRITKAACRQNEGSETKERKVKPAAEFERSIFKWAGGKFGVLEQIFRYLPEGKRLIEPFVGGGAVFMNAGYQENLLNDVNADLINFYKTLQREADSLITLAHRFFQDYNTQEGYLAVRNAFNKQVYDDLHRAAAFLFLNRHCFNGLTRYNQAGEFNVGYGKYKTPYFPLQEMEAFLGAEGRSEFVCGDFAAVIEAAGEGDVIFCDPPYEPLPNTEGFTNYSGHDFKFEEQKRLVSLLTDAHRRGAKVLITNSGAPNIRELYHDSGFRVEHLFARRSVSCKGDTRGVAHDVLGILL